MRKKRWKLFAALLLLSVCTAGYARFVEPGRLKVRTLSVETEKPVHDLRVVFFTDTHFGKLYDESHASIIADRINRLDADLVIFGGDLLDNYARDREDLDLGDLAETLGSIKAKAGKYAVWGNHDYGGGASRIYEKLMSDAGFEILDDESRTFEELGIRLIGYDDYLMGWTDPSLYKVKSNFFNLIVAHEPVIAGFIESESDNFMLSGHTHGGQIGIPGLVSKVVPPGSGKFVKGFYTAEEIGTDASLNMYTSSGIGMTKYPYRLFNVPEIIEINFHSSH